MITRDQIKLIWVLTRQLGMEGNELHDVVSAVTGKDSIKALSVSEGTEIIEVLIRAGGRVKKKRKPRPDLPPNVVELATRKQTRLVKHLEKRLGWHDNPERLKGFTRRIIKREGVRTKQEAIKVRARKKDIADDKSA
jgi:hypothetical protein